MNSHSPLRILIVEDSADQVHLLKQLFAMADGAFELQVAGSLAETRVRLGEEKTDVVLLDLTLPDSTSLQTFARVNEMAPTLPVVVMSGLQDVALALETVQRGAQDYLVKGQVDNNVLTRAIRYAVERKRADESVRRLYASEARAAENARLERGLLPQPLLRGDWIGVVAR